MGVRRAVPNSAGRARGAGSRVLERLRVPMHLRRGRLACAQRRRPRRLLGRHRRRADALRTRSGPGHLGQGGPAAEEGRCPLRGHGPVGRRGRSHFRHRRGRRLRPAADRTGRRRVRARQDPRAAPHHRRWQAEGPPDAGQGDTGHVRRIAPGHDGRLSRREHDGRDQHRARAPGGSRRHREPGTRGRAMGQLQRRHQRSSRAAAPAHLRPGGGDRLLGRLRPGMRGRRDGSQAAGGARAAPGCGDSERVSRVPQPSPRGRRARGRRRPGLRPSGRLALRAGQHGAGPRRARGDLLPRRQGVPDPRIACRDRAHPRPRLREGVARDAAPGGRGGR